jgi:chromosome condensin MukBEF complex kleisin-like MukF subunit
MIIIGHNIMDKLCPDLWSYLSFYLSETDFVHLTMVCKSYYNQYPLDKDYRISRIKHMIHRYNFTNIIYDLKKFRPKQSKSNPIIRI